MDLYGEEYEVGSNIVIATATILLYDLLITIDDEVNHVWLQPRTPGMLLFYLNRYLPFVDTLLALLLYVSVVDPEQCRSFYESITWIVVTGLIVSELILVLRTWALWGRDRRVLLILFSTLVISVAPGVMCTLIEMKSWQFVEVPLGGRGCNLESSSTLVAVTYCLIAFSETAVVILTMMKGYEHLRSTEASWVKHIYEHGLYFYIYLLLITLSNIVIPFTAPQPAYKLYMAVAQRVMHSILCNRVILLILKQRSISIVAASVSGQRTMTKSRTTANLETVFNPECTRQADVQSDVGQLVGTSDEHEMTIYRKDWTH